MHSIGVIIFNKNKDHNIHKIEGKQSVEQTDIDKHTYNCYTFHRILFESNLEIGYLISMY